MRFPPSLVPVAVVATVATGFAALSPAVPRGFGQGPPVSPTPPAAATVPTPPVPPLPEVVARVDGEPIGRAELERVAAALLNVNGRSPADLSPEERRKLMRAVTEEIITDRLVARRAADLPVSDADVDRRLTELRAGSAPAEFEAALQRTGQTVSDLRTTLRAEIRQGRWMEDQIAAGTKASDAEIAEYYQKNPANFQAPETVRASHILVRVTQDATPELTREKEGFARSLRERIVDQKEPFAELARQFSDDAGSREKGGDLGFFGADRMVPEFAAAAFRLGKEEVSEPVRTTFGYHLIRLTDRRAPHVVSLEEARPNIKTFLESDRRRQAASQLIARLHEQAKIEIYVP